MLSIGTLERNSDRRLNYSPVKYRR